MLHNEIVLFEARTGSRWVLTNYLSFLSIDPCGEANRGLSPSVGGIYSETFSEEEFSGHQRCNPLKRGNFLKEATGKGGAPPRP
jgi:hypothetical protein